MLSMVVEHAVAVVLLLVALLTEPMEVLTISLVQVEVTRFPVLLLYASLTNLETVFKVVLLIGNT
jgi:hypothetical protein